VPASPLAGRRFRAYTAKHLDALTARAGLDAGERLAVRAVATVLPFRTNAYVVEQLIDWDAAPDDPIYRLDLPAGRHAAHGGCPEKCPDELPGLWDPPILVPVS
jgi:L-lysine 2,3-aminomutase